MDEKINGILTARRLKDGDYEDRPERRNVIIIKLLLLLIQKYVRACGLIRTTPTFKLGDQYIFDVLLEEYESKNTIRIWIILMAIFLPIYANNTIKLFENLHYSTWEF